MSLRLRLMLLVVLASLLPALWIGWRFVSDSEAEIATAERALATAVDKLAADLDHRVQGTAQLHYGLARSGLLDNADKALCSAYLSEVRETYPQYTGIVTALPDGRLFCDSLRSGREVNLQDRGYFKRVINGAQLTVEPAFGRITGNSVLQVVYPARDAQGQLRFLLIASLNLVKFAQEALAQMSHAKVDLVILDASGTVMAWAGARPDNPKPGSSVRGTPLHDFVQAHAAGGVGETLDGFGRPMVWASTGHPAARQAGLTVLVGIPRAELVAPVRERLQQDLGFLGAAALLMLVGFWLFVEWSIRDPIGRIVSMVHALGAGNLGARIAAPFPRGEIGSLMVALNHTASSLESQHQAIQALGEQLRQAQKLEAIGTLAGGIAHDFNNVLGGILGNLAIAADEARHGQPVQQSLEQIRRAALRARELVQRIQAFSRRDAPKLTVQPLEPIVEEVLALVKVAAPAGVTLRSEVQALQRDILADATQLHQVLMNLCTNAWQALQGAPGTVTIGLAPIDTDAATRLGLPDLQRGACAHLWVRDTGCGIPVADREHVFEPFFTTKGPHNGTGLGLSIVHGIVAAHRGCVTLESALGQGSCFHVYLPLLSTPRRWVSTAPEANSAQHPGQGERVLYIDDDEVMRVMIERLLDRAGYQVATDASPCAALERLQSHPSDWDLIVTDFNMPEVSGLDVSRRVADVDPALPVLIISGHIAEELFDQARELGVRGVIRKENVMEELLPSIARALGKA